MSFKFDSFSGKFLPTPTTTMLTSFAWKREKKLTFLSQESRMIVYSDVLSYTGSERTVFTG